MRQEPKVVAEGPGRHYHPIRPKDFKLDSILESAITLARTFGKSEVEHTARNLIRFCQRRGGWYPFTVEELVDFYKEVGDDPRYIFFGLLGTWMDDATLAGGWRTPRRPYLVQECDGMYYITEHFISQCAKNLPKKAPEVVG